MVDNNFALAEKKSKFNYMKKPKSNITNDKERSAVQIALGQKKPQSEYEKKLQKDFDKIKKEKGVIDIPPDI
jgi:hypothetical protein